MEALKRTPNLSIRRSMELEDGTKIDVIGLTTRKAMALSNNKKYTDTERGLHTIAAKILVNGTPIVIDDLLDCFTDEEIIAITEFVAGKKEESEKNAE